MENIKKENDGNDINNFIIDFHVHVFPDKVAEKAVESIGNYYGIAMRKKGTLEDLFESGNSIGISKYVVHSSATKVEQVAAINEYMYFLSKNFDNIISFGAIHPDIQDINGAVDSIIKMGLKGIKLHPEFQEFDIDDPKAMRIYEAIEGKLPVLIHMGDMFKDSSRPKRLAKVLDNFPKLVVIAAHLGGYSMWDEAEQYLIGRNLYLDTSSSLFFISPEKAAQIIRKHGVDKVLFGTDYPMWDHKEELDRFYNIGLEQWENDMILRGNALKLLGLSC